MIGEVQRINLRGELRKDFEVQFPFEGREYIIHGTYKHDGVLNFSSKGLEIIIPDLCVPPSGCLGLYVQFTKRSDGYHFSVARGGSSYFHSPETQKFFEEFVQPVLEEKLPKNMKKLMKFIK